MKLKTIVATLVLAALTASVAVAQVNVRGYYRSDGTYVQPHVRSTPDSDRSNNYGPSRSSTTQPLYGFAAPQTRDADRDGIANMYDRDDDNDGIGDNSDRSQYGRDTSQRSSNSSWPY